MLIRIAIRVGIIKDDKKKINADIPPTMQPIRGKYLAALFKYSCENLNRLGHGILVKYINAVKKIVISSEIRL
jgi:hypothetical protein